MESFDLGELIGGIFGVSASFAVQVACAAICAAIFAAKNKSWVGGALLGFFLGPLGVFIAFVSGGWGQRTRRVYTPSPAPSPLPPRPTNTYAPPPARQVSYRFPGRCPNCNGPLHKKTVQSRSVSCWYCGSLIEGTADL